MPTEVIWSPYYQVRFKPRYLSIDVNNIGHQGMLPVDRAGPGYFLPHLLNRDAGGKPFDDVLIIGAGSGNDVAAALATGAGHVDAVEIDPVINELGRRHHPNRPYSDPRVSIHLDDGRSFVRKTTSALRPDQLRPGRFAGLALELFERPPGELPVHRAGLSRRQGQAQARRRVRDVQLLPPGLGRGPAGEAGRERSSAPGRSSSRCRIKRSISPSDNQRDYITFLLVGDGASQVVESIRSKFAAERFFWLNPQPLFNRAVNGFGPTPPVVPAAMPAPAIPEDRPGRGRAAPASTASRPTTGRSSTSASRRSRRSTCAAWRSWRCSRW